MGFTKRQVMNPTMVLVPTRPFSFSQFLHVQFLLVFLVVGLLSGTMIVLLVSSISVAHFSFRNRSLTRVESLFTTFVVTHTIATYCRFSVALHALMHPSLP